MANDKPDEGQAEKRAVPHQVHHYPVTQPDNSTRHQLILVTSVDEDGRARGVPVGWLDQQAEFAPGQLVTG